MCRSNPNAEIVLLREPRNLSRSCLPFSNTSFFLHVQSFFGTFVILLTQFPDSLTNPIQCSDTKPAPTLSLSAVTNSVAKLRGFVPAEGLE